MKRKLVERKAAPKGSWGIKQAKTEAEVQQKKIIPRRRYRDEVNSSVHWLNDEDSMPSEVNSVVLQKQRVTENGFRCYITGRLKINRAIYSL